MRSVAADPRRSGRLVDWNDARGFGFIEDATVEGRVFVHVKDFARGSPRPTVGDEVTYALVAGREGRPAASEARIAGTVPETDERSDAPLRVTVRIVGALMLTTAIGCCVVFGRTPFWMPLLYVVGGLVCFVAYAVDKRAAIRGEWRISETTLHVIDLLFGVVGGLLAQGFMRHKSSKIAFGIATAAIFALHMGALLAVLAGYGPAEWLAALNA